jgi:hypothetical protein
MACLIPALLLGASSARADSTAQQHFVTREEVPDFVLQGLIGIATVRTGPGTPELPRFEPSESTFRPAGTLKLTETVALSGWSYGGEESRDFPVIARRGDFLQIISNARTGETTWLQVQGSSTPLGTSVSFNSLYPEKDPEGMEIDLLFLLPPGERLVFRSAPTPAAREVKVPGQVLGSAFAFKVLDRQGDFLRVGIEESPEEPVRPLGWVRMKDPKGTLRVWPALLPGC